MVVTGLSDIFKELWTTRCGFIHGEGISTAKALRLERIYQLHQTHSNKYELLSIHDRHLLRQKKSYFYKSSTETLIVWEERIKKAINDLNNVSKDQPTISSIGTRKKTNVRKMEFSTAMDKKKK